MGAADPAEELGDTNRSVLVGVRSGLGGSAAMRWQKVRPVHVKKMQAMKPKPAKLMGVR